MSDPEAWIEWLKTAVRRGDEEQIKLDIDYIWHDGFGHGFDSGYDAQSEEEIEKLSNKLMPGEDEEQTDALTRMARRIFEAVRQGDDKELDAAIDEIWREGAWYGLIAGYEAREKEDEI